MAEEKAIQKFSNYMHTDIVKKRFQEVVGGGSGAFISSVVAAVASSDALQKCDLASIYTSAIRAATLRLSVDPALGDAYLVPYGGKATLIVGYKGLYDMAIRTGKYRYIHVGKVYEGEVIEEDRITGWHSISSQGEINRQKIIGWVGSFEMYPEKGSGQPRGLVKTIYMTVEEIHEHAQKYSKSYNQPQSGWVKETEKMERKTVLRLLLRRWGYLDPVDVKTLETIEDEPDSIDASFNDSIPDMEEREPKEEAQLLKELGFPSENPKEPPVTLSKINWTSEQMDCLIKSEYAPNAFSAKGMLGLSNLPEGATQELILEWGRRYREARQSLQSADAAKVANDWYTSYKESI